MTNIEEARSTRISRTFSRWLAVGALALGAIVMGPATPGAAAPGAAADGREIRVQVTGLR